MPRLVALESDLAELKRGSLPAGEEARISERLADLGEEVAELRADVRALRGEVDEVRHAAAQGPDVGATTAGGPDIAGPQPTDSAPLGGAPTAASIEIRDYESSFRLYRAGDYRRAIDRFEAFLQTHPSSDYADNALFWMGECYFKLGDHERAVLVFEDAVKRYPEGNKVPDALYRQGRALLEIGARSQQAAAYTPAARQVFERIVQDYPDSERVREAQRELERLGP
ncbi:MAG: tol-pal system protein YbgF [Myxococcota bacterium]